MKAIKNKKLYDTDKAEKIVHHRFMFFEESLYKTKKGNYFIHELNSYADYENIFPKTEDEAIEWLSDAGKIDIIEKLFGDKIEEA